MKRRFLLLHKIRRAVREPRAAFLWLIAQLAKPLTRFPLTRRVAFALLPRELRFRTEGVLEWGVQRFDRALECFQQAAAAGGDSAWTWIWLARAQTRLGHHDEALTSARRAQELVEESPAALLRVAHVLTDLKQDDDAVDLIERAERSGDRDEGVMIRSTRLLLRNGRISTALDSAEELLTRRLSDDVLEDALVVQISALLELGREDSARGALERAAKGDRDMAARAEGRALVGLARPREAWVAFKQADASAVRPANIRVLARQLLTHGHLTEAAEAAELGVALDPRNSLMRHLRDRIVGERSVLRDTWHPGTVKTGSMIPEPGTVLHLVGKTLPYTQAGYTVRTQYVVKAQRDLDIDAQVMSKLGFPFTVDVNSAPTYEEIDGVPHHRLLERGLPGPAPDVRLRHNVQEAAEVVRRVRPAALHAASDYENALVALDLGSRFGIPVVYEVRGFWEETWLSSHDESALETEYYRLRRERETACMLGADRIVTLSEVMRDEMAARGVDAGKITVVPNAVDPDAFPLLTERDAEIGARVGLGPDDATVGYISSFTGYEGIRYLIDAVARLVEQGRRVTCLLVGDGKERAALEQQVRTLGIGDRVHFTGRVPHDEVLRYYSAIDVFVVPRTNDRVCHLVTPLKPFEAMATGRALVVSKTRALSELVTDGETGMSFTPEDADDLADVLGRLIDDPDQRQRLGAAAAEWVRANHTWARNGRRYRELYESLGVL